MSILSRYLSRLSWKDTSVCGVVNRRVLVPPTSKKLRRHIGLGLSVRAHVRPWVTFCLRSGTVRDRILKFDMRNKYET